MNIQHDIVTPKLAPDTSKDGAVLLMTATLNPPPGAVARADPGERLADYAAALAFYLQVPAQIINRIIIADNSFAGMDFLRPVAADTKHDKVVEMMSFAANDHAVSLGKAYGEFRLMDMA